MSFLQFRLIDVIDIILVAFLMYKIYTKVRGTMAINILLGLIAFIAFWITIKSLKMELTGSILDTLVNVGVLALIIVFQQEIRRSLLHFGSKYKWLLSNNYNFSNENIEPIIKACENFSKSQTGALIIITGEAGLKEYIETGEIINADISSRLIESIFFKNNPLHDGALIVLAGKLIAASCILPVSENPNMPKYMGLRHRAAMGITESTDAVAVVVSEERGEISFFQNGTYNTNINTNDLQKLLKNL
ncbi:MAG: diadenylate cyclase CdaA [Marinilabiliaceae bacterium]|nr:diadenylate cyclase CdaA [Marinilabiliaceae bacterium]